MPPKKRRAKGVHGDADPPIIVAPVPTANTLLPNSPAVTVTPDVLRPVATVPDTSNTTSTQGSTSKRKRTKTWKVAETKTALLDDSDTVADSVPLPRDNPRRRRKALEAVDEEAIEDGDLLTVVPPPPFRRPIPRIPSESEENFDLDVSSSSESSTERSEPINKTQRPAPARSEDLQDSPPNPPQRQPLRPRSQPPSIDSGRNLCSECDDTCDCALFTGSELEDDVEEGGKKIIVADLKHFFRRPESGEWICKKCARVARNHPGAKLATYTYGAKTSSGVICEHLKHHRESHERWCAKHGQPNKTKRGKEEKKASEKAAGNVAQLSPARPRFTEDSFKEALVTFIVEDDQSLNVIERRAFRDLLLLLREDLDESDIPKRTKIRELIIKSWKKHMEVLRAELAQAQGRVSLTADVWSDRMRHPYLGITAHWIKKNTDGHLSLETALIAFHRLFGRHDGQNLANVALAMMDRVGITTNVGHITMDNAENNDKMVEVLQGLLSKRDIAFHHQDRRIRCLPHILNICSGHVLDAFTNKSLIKDAGSRFTERLEDLDDRQTYAEALENDPVSQGRNIVNVLRVSGQRRDQFEDYIREGNKAGYWDHAEDEDGVLTGTGEKVELPILQLLRDVKTRWDSVYYMIRRLRRLHQPINAFLDRPNNKDLKKYKLTMMEWRVLRDFQLILEIPHQAIRALSHERLPTLCKYLVTFEKFYNTWMRLRDDKNNIQLRPFIEKGLEWVKKYYHRMGHTKAYLIAMLLNPNRRLTWIRANWDSTDFDDVRKIVFDTASMNEYHHRHFATSRSPETRHPTPSRNKRTSPWKQTLARRLGYDINSDDESSGDDEPCLCPVEQELNSYEGLHVEKKTDILNFWEGKDRLFPTLYRMAMDYLAVQGSAVPCERIFSSSAETDTKKRNRIKPILMEALQILKFYKKSSLNFTAGLILEVEDMEEEDPEDLLGELLSATRQSRAQRSLDKILTSLRDHGEEAPEDVQDEHDDVVDSECKGEDGEDSAGGEA